MSNHKTRQGRLGPHWFATWSRRASKLREYVSKSWGGINLGERHRVKRIGHCREDKRDLSHRERQD